MTPRYSTNASAHSGESQHCSVNSLCWTRVSCHSYLTLSSVALVLQRKGQDVCASVEIIEGLYEVEMSLSAGGVDNTWKGSVVGVHSFEALNAGSTAPGAVS